MRTVISVVIIALAIIWVVYFLTKLVKEVKAAVKDGSWIYIPVVAVLGLAIIYALSFILPWLADQMGEYGEFFKNGMSECNQ